MAKSKFILLQFILLLNVFVIKTKAFVYEAPSRCINPNGRSGLCVSVYECQTLLNIFKTNQMSNFAFVRKLECSPNGQGRRPYVCCTADTGFTSRNHRIIFPQDPAEDEDQLNSTTTSTTVKTPREYKNYESTDFSLFPKPPLCGPLKIVTKIVGGEEAELGEFPWLANLEYKNAYGALESACAGNILNQRYILTAAHCVKGEIEIKVGKLVSVRVGVHNTQTPVDCNDSGCLDPFQRMGVERVIAHTAYGHNKGYRNYNDIALIRTDRNIRYSSSVAPICLPDVLTQKVQLRNGINLSVAGWGHTGTSKYSAFKRKIALPYVENEDCPIKLAPEQLCAGGVYRKDSCSGDSGGGLVRLVGASWIVEGIVSYGRGCGLEMPAVYTRVSSYIPWIRANVQP